MSDQNKQSNEPDVPDVPDVPDQEQDVEGHSMFLYEAARQLSRQQERDTQQHAREARLLKESREQKGK
jgi:hypothetical protein